MNQSAYNEGYTLTLKQAAQRLNVGVKELRRMITTGAVDARRTDTGWLIRPARDSVQARHQSTSLTLWHGTSEDLVPAIREQGFKARTKKKQVWFTENYDRARRHAGGRARTRGSRPAVFTCEISLLQYPHFWNPRTGIYVFAHTIDKDVIKKVDTFEADDPSEDKERIPSVGVMVTQTSGIHGVLYWINEYLALLKRESLDTDHPAVVAISQWVDDQYADGRTDPIAEDELVEMVDLYLL